MASPTKQLSFLTACQRVIGRRLRRRAARARRPQAEEIWSQDNQTLLYIDHVGPNGVSVYAMGADKQFIRWTDSWEAWEARLRARVVVYTGMRRPLGNE
jgi:hypothetical protein